ncbi:MAG: alkyl hydroperoxide reductase, partial [Corynebacterium sp.]|nr:alkyl hydroperoxide reductase [Corynebacterium sp.]
AHAHELNEAGLSKEQVWEAVKVAAVVQAVAQAVQIEAAR